MFLSNNPIVKKFIQVSKGDTKEYRTTLLEEFKALLESRTSYFQIRLIGTAHDGKELIRVEREGALTKIVADSNLQEKGDRNYFLETIKLQTGSVYYSEIDLNREFFVRSEIRVRSNVRARKSNSLNGRVSFEQ